MENVMSNGFTELSAKEMETVEGGIPGWLETMGAIWVCYELGYAVGKAIAHGTSK